MVDYELIDNGENSYKIEWLGKRPKLNLKNLYSMYKSMKFISTCGKSTQCSQFGEDLQVALQNSLGKEYNVEVNIGHFYISGFVSKDDKYVYFSVEDLRDDDKGFEDVLYRTAKHNKDYTGGRNNFCKLTQLADNIKLII